MINERRNQKTHIHRNTSHTAQRKLTLQSYIYTTIIIPSLCLSTVYFLGGFHMYAGTLLSFGVELLLEGVIY